MESPVKVLVVEDDDAKFGRIVSAVISGNQLSRIERAPTVLAARRLLREQTFDLLILDVALPLYPDSFPVRDAGMSLLREIVDFDEYRKPRYVVGVTAFTDLVELHSPEFESRFWYLMQVATGDDSWRKLLADFVRHISKVPRASDESAVDFCVLTALAQPEFSSILELDWSWQPPIRLDDSTFYRLGSFESEGKSWTVAAGCALRMGPVPASVLASKFVSSLRPKVVALAGICAGIRGECSLGDPIAASEVWSWESGKYVVTGGGEFHPEPVTVHVPDQVAACMQQLQQDRKWLDSVRASYGGQKPSNCLELRIAPMASGSPVVADASIVARIRETNRKTAAIEMESFGALFASRSSAGPRPLAFCVKSACDFADEHKDDSMRSYAAFTSAQVVRELFERFGASLIVG